MSEREPASRLQIWLSAYLIAAVTFALIDAVWLGVVANRLYQSELGHLLAETFDPVPAVLFYLLYIVGLIHFAVRPNDADRSLGQRLLDAALFGLVTYATWDLTSAAVFRDFPWTVVVIDLAWGVFVCTTVKASTWWLLTRRGLLPRT